jgi:chromosome segregation ATPase
MLNNEIKSSLAMLHKELERLSPAIDLVDRANSSVDAVKQLPIQYEKLLADLHALEVTHREDVKEILKSDIASLETRINGLIDSLTNYSSDIKVLTHALTVQKIENHEFIETLKRIDFPTRLNAIEQNGSQVASGFNNVQSTATSIKDELVRMERALNNRLQSIEDSNRTGNLLLMITMGLAVIGAIFSILSFFA